MASYKVVIISLAILLAFIGKSSAELNKDHYKYSCPHFEDVVREAIIFKLGEEPRMLPSILRLHFHDCFVHGCDGSILLRDTTSLKGEMNAGPNRNSVGGFEVIESIKATLEKPWNCKGVVSCADILTLAARESVFQLGGHYWDLKFGRRDGYVTANSFADVNKYLPSPNSNITELKRKFSALKFDVTDLVALSGAHTIGQARCVNFRERIHNKASLINSTFAAERQKNCPIGSVYDDKLAPLDILTPSKFDNKYYKDLVSQQGLLHSDQELHHHDRDTARLVNEYSNNQITFFADFSRAMTKMSLLTPLTGKQGEIRKYCYKVNKPS